MLKSYQMVNEVASHPACLVIASRQPQIINHMISVQMIGMVSELVEYNIPHLHSVRAAYIGLSIYRNGAL